MTEGTGKLETTDEADRPPVGASVWERDLWDHLTGHVRAERSLLETYSAIARETQSKAFGYLVNLLLEDEIRHHRMFTELAGSLKSEAELGGKAPSVPHMDLAQADSAAVLEATGHLIEQEEQDARELHKLQRELRDVKDTTLWSLLVDLMERDTEKHIALLKFVKKHTGR
ncbi:MAG TPA: hypothetical protein VMU76_03200 [Acidimicrobiales bacterium]|nr:hypothetical protein [Acidimicrobiales bacterium]